MSDDEEDHLVSLELGGSPASPANRWPGAHNDGRFGSHVKGRIEDRLLAQVCRRMISLSNVQHEIATLEHQLDSPRCGRLRLFGG